MDIQGEVVLLIKFVRLVSQIACRLNIRSYLR